MSAARPGEVWTNPDGRRHQITRNHRGEYIARDTETGEPTLIDTGTLEQDGWQLEQPVFDLGDL